MRIPCLLLLTASFALAQQGGRDPWERMRRQDVDGDGKVTREEFRGPDRVFDRLDTNADGSVTAEEARNAMRGGRAQGGTDRLTRALDADGDGAISAAEWQAFFERADGNGDGVLQSAEWTAALRGSTPSDPAPRVGDAAPAVKAHSAKDGSLVDLSAPKRPTVLVFGSWT